MLSDGRGQEDGSFSELLASSLTRMPHFIMPKSREMALGPEGALQIPRRSPTQDKCAYKPSGQK